MNPPLANPALLAITLTLLVRTSAPNAPKAPGLREAKAVATTAPLDTMALLTPPFVFPKLLAALTVSMALGVLLVLQPALLAVLARREVEITPPLSAHAPLALLVTIPLLALLLALSVPLVRSALEALTTALDAVLVMRPRALPRSLPGQLAAKFAISESSIPTSAQLALLALLVLTETWLSIRVAVTLKPTPAHPATLVTMRLQALQLAADALKATTARPLLRVFALLAPLVLRALTVPYLSVKIPLRASLARLARGPLPPPGPLLETPSARNAPLARRPVANL